MISENDFIAHAGTVIFILDIVLGRNNNETREYVEEYVEEAREISPRLSQNVSFISHDVKDSFLVILRGLTPYFYFCLTNNFYKRRRESVNGIDTSRLVLGKRNPTKARLSDRGCWRNVPRNSGEDGTNHRRNDPLRYRQFDTIQRYVLSITGLQIATLSRVSGDRGYVHHLLDSFRVDGGATIRN